MRKVAFLESEREFPQTLERTRIQPVKKTKI